MQHLACPEFDQLVVDGRRGGSAKRCCVVAGQRALVLHSPNNGCNVGVVVLAVAQQDFLEGRPPQFVNEIGRVKHHAGNLDAALGSEQHQRDHVLFGFRINGRCISGHAFFFQVIGRMKSGFSFP
ncbi:MAG: hypothetical protein OES79_03370 [Planctomycetota bacterium]|nr:hypothetical protein [Planctomycetota bacterium]